METSAKLAVFGSVNLDIVATGPALPAPGETVTDAVLAFHPGGKGANQALAANRLGGEISLFARVGSDDTANQALYLLKENGVDLTGVFKDANAKTGVALIAVNHEGENQIIVAPGANDQLTPQQALSGLDQSSPHDGILCQLEIPVETVVALAEYAKANKQFFALNAAPAKSLPNSIFENIDLLVVNENEAAFYGDHLSKCKGLIAITYGARGAALFKGKNEIANASPPKVSAIDTTGAGDAFTAALTLALVQKRNPDEALKFACAAGAFATTKPGAQPSFGTAKEIATQF